MQTIHIPKPRLRRLHRDRWHCRSATPNLLAVGCTPEDAYANWLDRFWSQPLYISSEGKTGDLIPMAPSEVWWRRLLACIWK